MDPLALPDRHPDFALSKVSKMRKAINKRLKEAEAEILRIKKQEGWS